MKWEGGRRGGNVEDRRGLSGGAVAGGGVGMAIIALIAYFVFGVDPGTIQGSVGGGAQQQGEIGTPDDTTGRFVDVIGANMTDVWSQALKGYSAPKIVLYEQGTSTGCGYGQSAMGPFYCPMDQTVYLDLGFYREMVDRLGASGGDFAQAYVLAHEVGHHVQNLTGTMNKVRSAQERVSSQAEANRYSVALELQADCYAGVWAANASAASGGEVALEPGDLEEGLKTANAIGDDSIQAKTQGRVTPEGFTHGTSEQRMEWLSRGYQTGDPSSCNTFQ